MTLFCPASQGIVVIAGHGGCVPVHASSISVCFHWSPRAGRLVLWIVHCISAIGLPPVFLPSVTIYLN